MKRIPIIMLMSIFIMGIVLSSSIAGAEENATVNTTESPTITATTTISPTETAIADPKFRVGPTVTLRPVNDVIDKSQDGIVELYMDNPSLNDVTLNVDARISVPSGIHVYGEGFGQAGAAGTIYGTFSIPPGKARTIYINVKADKTGSFTVHFSGLYWPDDNKDDFNPISLTHPFVVNEPSPNPDDPEPTDKKEIPYTYIIVGLIIVIALAIVVRRPPKTEVTIEEK